MRRRTFLATIATAGAVTPGLVVAQQANFAAWLQALKLEGLQRGLSRRTLDEGLADVAIIDRVIELDRSQPETTLTFEQYIARVVPPQRVETARNRLAENRDLLAQVSARFNVQPRFIVALWGVESDFGRIGGNFPVVGALATLAYEGRRATFFREELFAALKIIERGHASARDMRGSSAGAMGQCQFMPSTYLAYAVDFDGNGKPDIWTSRADVFASTANYLARLGWKGDETWGREVRLPGGFDRSQIDVNKVQKPLADWQALGVRSVDGSALPARAVTGSLVQPGGADGQTYLVYANFRSVMKWNRSTYFATAVGLLADRIANA